MKNATMTFKRCAIGMAALAVLAAASTSAQARYGRNTAFVGGVAAGLIGAGIAANAFARPAYGYYGPVYAAPPPAPACWRERQALYDRFGYPAGYRMIRVCE
ncbi:MAG: hypothetical protein FJX29_04345 [Alphaproteobacteria bacterium]|nr:hypothetical protein [Alphaproteobacteria bacterium]